MKGSSLAVAHPDDDLYNGDHGRYVLTMSPGQDPMNILPFAPVSYDITDNKMKAKDPSRPEDFIDISGSKMRKLAAQHAKPCPTPIPKGIDVVKENCVPPGFMVQSGWEIVCDYYSHVESEEWKPYSIMMVDPMTAKSATHSGAYGTKHFKLFPTEGGKELSAWHDILYKPSANGDLYNFVVEIPMYSTAKMEMMKDVTGNPIMQDTKDGKMRYYTYGVPFFNYGLIPQTWENTTHDDGSGHKGDGDPIDAIEIGAGPLGMGSVVRVKVLGSLLLIDEGETDHKIIVLREDDPHFNSINSMDDLDRYRPGSTKMLVDWMKNYKTSDGKPQNTLGHETPLSATEAKKLIEETHDFYVNLVKRTTNVEKGYWLPSTVKGG